MRMFASVDARKIAVARRWCRRSGRSSPGGAPGAIPAGPPVGQPHPDGMTSSPATNNPGQTRKNSIPDTDWGACRPVRGGRTPGKDGARRGQRRAEDRDGVPEQRETRLGWAHRMATVPRTLPEERTEIKATSAARTTACAGGAAEAVHPARRAALASSSTRPSPSGARIRRAFLFHFLHRQRP